MLKTVRTPSSLRGPIACCMAGWNFGANMKQRPWASRIRSTSDGSRSTRAPRASSKSALPQRLVTARFPCFATLTPAAATTNIAIVETLNVVNRAPPVPHRSTTRPSSRDRMRTDRSRIAVAMPAISSGPSPFIRSPIRNAPICAGVACESMISAIAAYARPKPRDAPVARSPIAS